MEDLASIEEFEIEDRPIYDRADSILFGFQVVVMAVLAAVFGADWSATGLSFWRGLGMATMIGVVIGVVVASLLLLIERGHRGVISGRRLRRIYAADPTIVPPAPPGALSRLPCALFLSRKSVLPGILYLTAAGLVFQPNFLMGRWWQWRKSPAPDPLVMGPARTLQVDAGTITNDPWWMRRLGVQPIPVLICSWQDASALFRVPLTATVAHRMQTGIDQLRQMAELAV